MKNLLTIILLTIFSTSLLAQHQKCKTNEVRTKHINENPAIKYKVQEIETFTQQWSKTYNELSHKTLAVVTVPVVVHVVYRTAAENISTAQINSQITVLNDDFRKMNSNFSSTPMPFQSVAADCEIEFCLATKDPNGNPTTGITRTSTTKSQLGDSEDYFKTASGGKNPWDRTKYINIWVCSIDGGSTLGFATPPGTAMPANSDGLVIDPIYFGTVGTAAASAPNHLGRTATHEMGHYFNLEHIWGLNGGCNDDDLVGDTPNQDFESQSCPSFPAFDNCTSSGNGIMFCNYLDYSNDNCMTMFTNGQKVRMLAALNGPRSGLLAGNICGGSVAVNDINISNLLEVYPTPAINTITITNNTSEKLDASLINPMGQTIKQFTIQIVQKTMDVTNLAAGIYYLRFSNKQNGMGTKKIIIRK